jgi:hypothetical protein
VDDYLSATPAVPAGNSPYTIEAWIKTTAMNTGTIAAWGNFGFNSQVNAFRLTPTGLVNYWWGNDLSVTVNLIGAWHHVAATFDGTTRRILVDGVVLGSGPALGHNAGSGNFHIGSANGGEFFAGQMDEVRVWSVGRTATQIQGAMRRQLPGNEPGLVVCYRFDDGAGLLASETTSGGGYATLVNGLVWIASDIRPFAPTVRTLAPGAITSTTATLNGAANPNSGATTAYFEWGPTPSLGNVTATQALGSGTADVAWSSPLNGLNPGAIYYYRAVATSSHGTSFGEILSVH